MKKDTCGYHVKGDGSWWEYDIANIPLCRVCDKCREIKLSHYNPEVLPGLRANRHYAATGDEIYLQGE